jgi:ketosteroid isomerase-like protein
MLDTMTPVATPVTGTEYRGEQHLPMQALAQFYLAINSRDLSLLESNWEHSPDAVMDNPLGGIKRGWDEIHPLYERLFATPASYHFEFYDYTLHTGGDVFYVVGRERGSVTQNGRTLSLAIRTSRIFRRDAKGLWRQVHHHGSIDDAKMLADYQQAVLGAAA